MEWHVILSAVLGVVGFFITVFGLWYKIDHDTNAKIDAIEKNYILKSEEDRKISDQKIGELGKEFAAQLARAIEEGDAKRARIYERLDTVKTAHRAELDTLRKDVFDSFVSSKWCKMIHDNADRIYKDFKDSINKLTEKVDMLIKKG
jgi:hypothetical protein